MNTGIIVAIVCSVILVVIVILLITRIKIVRQTQKLIVERLGAYHATWSVGFHFLVPFIDRVAQVVSMKEQVNDFDPQPVITKDNVTMQIDTVVFFQVTDPKLYSYGVENPIAALENLSSTTLRNIIGELDLDETLTSRDIINTKMRSILDEATDPWGIKVNRVEVKNILPPKDIRDAMERQMRAERERREKILLAEGEKRSQILQAEGEKESQILRAEAEKEALALVYVKLRILQNTGNVVHGEIPGQVQLSRLQGNILGVGVGHDFKDQILDGRRLPVILIVGGKDHPVARCVGHHFVGAGAVDVVIQNPRLIGALAHDGQIYGQEVEEGAVIGVQGHGQGGLVHNLNPVDIVAAQRHAARLLAHLHAEGHVLRGQLASVVKVDVVSQVDGIGVAVRVIIPGLGDAGQHISLQIVIDKPLIGVFLHLVGHDGAGGNGVQALQVAGQ